MPTDVRILAARRAWEFGPDDIRLTALTLAEVQALIKEAFEFQTALVATPMPTFGPALASIPPGLVFDNGAVRHKGRAVPIRFLHFEVQRLVIDVAGSSEAAGEAYSQLRSVLKNQHAPDGSAVLGEPRQTRELSHLSARLAFPGEALFATAFVKVFSDLPDVDQKQLTFAPSLYWTALQKEADFPGIPDGDPSAFQIAPRAGYPVGERVYFSAAPLSTSEHLSYLARVESAIRQRAPAAAPSRQRLKRGRT